MMPLFGTQGKRNQHAPLGRSSLLVSHNLVACGLSYLASVHGSHLLHRILQRRNECSVVVLQRQHQNQKTVFILSQR
jgi:hypothetical protein